MAGEHRLSYRPEIDGLRAIAVVPVLLFHAGLGMPGGFVGVDVFFVISGYLITSLILKDVDAGRFTLADFWERRVRRIFPAALAMVFATLLAGWFLLLPSEYERLARAALSQVVFGANFFYWRNADYFAGPAEHEPLLHTWSLAVEEQFYVLFPLILGAIACRPPLRQRSVMLALMSVPLFVSCAACVYATSRYPVASFYLLPTRSWELLCGSVLAVTPPCRWLTPLTATAVGWMGLAMIAYTWWGYDKTTTFPGAAAILPCLGAMLVIYATAHEPLPNGRTLRTKWLVTPRQILAARLPVGIGLISYSLYLWHWPPLAFANILTIKPLPLSWRVVLLAGSVVAAIASWRYIETPFRTKQIGPTRRTMFTLSTAGLLGIVFITAGIVACRGFPSRFSCAILACDEVRTEPQFPKRTSLAAVQAGDIPRLGTLTATSPSALIWGDSHCRCLAPVMNEYGMRDTRSIQMIWHPATPPVCGYVPPGNRSLGNATSDWADLVIQHVLDNDVRHVVLVAAWSNYLGKGRAQQFSDALLRTVIALRNAQCCVWIMREVPIHSADVPRMLRLRETFNVDVTPFVCGRQTHVRRNAAFDKIVPELLAAGAHLLDPAPWMLGSDGDHYAIIEGTMPLYSDSSHISVAGARRIAACFEPLFKQIAAEHRVGCEAIESFE
jgi:peptidoglycan/LPS O-acetylase OafA/YrhL